MLSGKKFLSVLASATAIAGLGIIGQAPASAASMPRLVNYTTGLCATPYGGGKAEGTLITQWECNGDPSQEFQYKETQYGQKYYYNPNSKKCLSVDYPAEGGNLILESCDELQETQYWDESNVDRTETATSNMAANWAVITTKGGKTSWGAVLTVWGYNGSAAQNWGHR